PRLNVNRLRVLRSTSYTQIADGFTASIAIRLPSGEYCSDCQFSGGMGSRRRLSGSIEEFDPAARRRSGRWQVCQRAGPGQGEVRGTALIRAGDVLQYWNCGTGDFRIRPGGVEGQREQRSVVKVQHVSRRGVSPAVPTACQALRRRAVERLDDETGLL